MKAYLDLIAYPFMVGAVYILIGFINWDRNPDMWTFEMRILWIVWGITWGYALQLRIKRGGV